MKLMINGQEKSVPHHLQTILDLLQELNLDPGFIIVEKTAKYLIKIHLHLHLFKMATGWSS